MMATIREVEDSDAMVNSILNSKCAGGCGVSSLGLGIDNLCSSCRRKAYDDRKCHNCTSKYKDGDTGWYVPNFRSYIDIIYWCPECILKHNEDIERAKTELPELEAKYAELRKKLHNLKFDFPLNYVYEENGDYHLESYGTPSFNEFKEQVREYKRNKGIIDRQREEEEKLCRESEEVSLSIKTAKQLSRFSGREANT